MQLSELYRQVIMDHYQNPRNQGQLEDAVSVDLRNPSCGDEITLQMLIKDGVVEDVRFKGSGCSISMASASMMTEAVKGLTVDEALKLGEQFRLMIRGQEVTGDELGDLEALQGVSQFPARVKCATLAWQALDRAAHSHDGPHTD
ncbi:SUF system NifU family Fe-S cluster assembly protein [Alicyclobacillus curvatus]|jgi:nitrogen fixation protein NifU and related proteins|nr:SUF system NifU family Fe-S cluster assembly protein [Alicyclobacillus curvatus]